jgi:hypothetical protein
MVNHYGRVGNFQSFVTLALYSSAWSNAPSNRFTGEPNERKEYERRVWSGGTGEGYLKHEKWDE